MQAFPICAGRIEFQRWVGPPLIKGIRIPVRSATDVFSTMFQCEFIGFRDCALNDRRESEIKIFLFIFRLSRSHYEIKGRRPRK